MNTTIQTPNNQIPHTKRGNKHRVTAKHTLLNGQYKKGANYLLYVHRNQPSGYTISKALVGITEPKGYISYPTITELKKDFTAPTLF